MWFNNSKSILLNAKKSQILVKNMYLKRTYYLNCNMCCASKDVIVHSLSLTAGLNLALSECLHVVLSVWVLYCLRVLYLAWYTLCVASVNIFYVYLRFSEINHIWVKAVLNKKIYSYAGKYLVYLFFVVLNWWYICVILKIQH